MDKKLFLTMGTQKQTKIYSKLASQDDFELLRLLKQEYLNNCLVNGQQNLFKIMRNRYFSPELRSTMPSPNSAQFQKLRWMGSLSNLPLPITSKDSQQQIGPYTFFKNKQIGSGYSSKVYKGKKKGSEEEYAVKVIELKKYSNSNMQMLENQISIIRKLDHPNVIRCYDVYKTSTRCYIVMEYCPHGDLLQLLSRKGTFSEVQAKQIMKQVIEGCQYLISKNIIHRDIKPANIIKGKANWKIADFGFAVKSQSSFQSKYNVGTPLYMPPQALVKNLYSVQSDIFAVGILFFQLLVGTAPWESKTEKDLIRKMNLIPFKIPARIEMSLQVKNLLKSLCEVDTQKRMKKDQFVKLKLFNKKQQPKDIYFQELPMRRSVQLDQKRKQYLKNRVGSFQNLQSNKIKTLQSQSTNQNEEEEQVQKAIYTQNNKILLNQLHYCRFLYYLIKNSQSLLMKERPLQKLNTILFKHIVKLIKQLGDDTENWLKLKQWKSFKMSKLYKSTLQTLKEYANRYEKEYMSHIEHSSIEVIREVNKQFPQFLSNNQFTTQLYAKIINYLCPVIRQANHNLGLVMFKNPISITKEINGSIQALKSVYRYYKLVEMSAMCNYDDFQRNSKIRVNADYSKVRLNSGSAYIQLRNQIKNI